jgi:hypothetical protein
MGPVDQAVGDAVGGAPAVSGGVTPERPAEGGRERCPVCGARRGPEAACRRCRGDLSLLLAVEDRADAAFRAALDAYRSGCFRLAAARAGEAVRLEARPNHLRLLAASALRAGDFAGAVAAARRALRAGSTGG